MSHSGSSHSEASFYLEVAVDLSRYFPSLLSKEGPKRCLAFLLLIIHSRLSSPFSPPLLASLWKSVSTLPIPSPSHLSAHAILSEKSDLLTTQEVKQKMRTVNEIMKAAPPGFKKSCTTLTCFSLLVLAGDAYYLRITPSSTLYYAQQEIATLAAKAIKRRAASRSGTT